MEKTKRGIKKDFTLMALLLIPVAVAINIIGGQIILFLNTSIYLDAIGTILVSVLVGPWVGALTGLITYAMSAIFTPMLFPYVIVSIVIGIVAGYLAKAYMFETFVKTILSGMIIGVITGIVSAPISYYIFGGATGNGTALITTVLLESGQKLYQSVLTGGIVSDLADKVISTVIIFLFLRSMPDRYLSKFRLGSLFMKKKNG